jgi:seryl-tRNA synthetase
LLDIQFIRSDPERVRQAARLKHIDAPVDELLEADTRRRQLLAEVEALRAEKNRVSKSIPKLEGDERQAAIAAMKRTGQREKELGPELAEVEQRFRELMLKMPAVPDPDVPEGKDDADNQELRRWGVIPEFDFEVQDHIELGSRLGILDLTRGVRLAGTRNYILKGDGALLHWAVLRYALDFAVERGFVPMVVPHLVRDEAMVGTAWFPGGEEQAYRLERDGLNLIGTSEVPVTAYHGSEILREDELPKYYAGYSPCYRREAGAAGRDTKGLYRIHQFDKVEQVVVTRADAEESAREHDHILRNAEELVQKLGLPYRVVLVCSGDLSMGQARKYDIETWMPSRGSYGETHSATKYYEFQARRLGLRYRDGDGQIRFAHTLNNTLVASPRILIALLELNQQADGSVVIPAPLRPYMAGRERLRPT